MKEIWPDGAEPAAEAAEASVAADVADVADVAEVADVSQAAEDAAGEVAAAGAMAEVVDEISAHEVEMDELEELAELAEMAGLAGDEDNDNDDEEEGEPPGGQVEEIVEAINPVHERNGFDAYHESDRGKYIYVMGGNFNEIIPGSVQRYIIEEDEWELVEGSMPHTGSGSAVLVWGTCIWVIGGVHDAVDSLTQVYRYDYQENNWYYDSAMLHARAYFGAVLVDSCIYVIGGRHRNTMLNSVEKYSLDHGWEECPPMEMRRCRFGCYSVEKDIFVLGGLTQEFQAIMTIERFDTLTLQWSFHIHSLLRSRVAFGVAVVGDVAFAMGGDDGNTVASFHVNNPNDNNCVSGLLMARSCASAVVASGLVYVIGGIQHNNTSFSKVIECFNPVTKLWIRLRDIPRPGAGGAALVLDPAIHGPL